MTQTISRPSARREAKRRQGQPMNNELAVVRAVRGDRGDIIGRDTSGRVVIFEYPPQVEPGVWLACRMLENFGRFVRADCLFPFRNRLVNGPGPGRLVFPVNTPEEAEAGVEEALAAAIVNDRAKAAESPAIV